MSAATADIRTEWGSRYLGQLCVHVSHNRELSVSLQENSGVIRFPAGDCALNATAGSCIWNSIAAIRRRSNGCRR